MKIVVAGSGGRLGAALARGLSARHEVTGFGRAELNLNVPGDVRSKVSALDFDVLVNCAAITNVDYCEGNADEAMRVNAESPRVMAEIAERKGARMIQIGTDYVFDGIKPGRRTEDEAANPLGKYGESKLAGDLAVTGASPRHSAIRVSWVFGPDRDSFIDMILKRALENEKVEAIGDKYSSPTYTEDFTGWLEALLAARDAGGLLHLCNRGETTWRDYGQLALDIAREEGVPFRATEVGSIRVADLKAFVAPRPIHTAMDTARFETLTGVRPRPWQEAVRDYVRTTLVPRLRTAAVA